jgi:uncharacterized iron-regulated protein
LICAHAAAGAALEHDVNIRSDNDSGAGRTHGGANAWIAATRSIPTRARVVDDRRDGDQIHQTFDKGFMSLSSVFSRIAVVVIALGGCVPAARVASPVSSPVVGDPGFRIVAPDARTGITWAQMIDRLARADVVFFGEQHDDPETHRAETAVLESLGRVGRPVVLSLEMFERDVQPVLDDYLAGRVSEADFLARSRPWPRYASDYRPLVELAKARGWPVIAANVPRPLASAVGRKALAALDTLSPAERRFAARDNVCPADDYRARFMEQMQGHGAGGASAPSTDTLPTAMAERFYLAQCVKDEAMAESIVEARRRAPRNAIVVHFNGSFHSDFAQGTVERVRRREPRWALAVVTAIPARDPAVMPIAPQSGRADVVIVTRAPSGR